MSSDIKSVSEQIDDIIAKPNDWRSNTLAQLRAVMTQSGLAIDEEVKWKKPSKPEGIPVWTHDGKNICMADTLKSAVRLTFPKGAQLADPKGLFNARLDSKTIRAIDFYKDIAVDSDALRSLVADAIALH